MKKNPPEVTLACARGQEVDRRKFLATAAQLASATLLASPVGTSTAAGEKNLIGVNEKGDVSIIVHAPSDPLKWPAWREQLAKWREARRKSINYDGSLYKRPEFAWAPSCYCICFLLMWDEMFYDPEKRVFAVESFLDHGSKEFGGYDGIVLWHAYPKIGFDARNQFDFYRDMPGSLEGLRQVSGICHARGVKVFMEYNPWDTGTRREGKSDLDALAETAKAIEADGIFLDTMTSGAKEFRAKLDAARPGVALETEGALDVERIPDHHLSWVQWFADGEAPGVLRNKWFERRHMMHQIKRWDHDHTGELHTAWMNGSGMLVWENVFGSWVGWNARDRSILRSMLPIQRRYIGLFSGEGWTPLVKTDAANVYASLWEGNGLRLWTLVNQSEKPVKGTLLTARNSADARYFDLIAGREIKAGQDVSVSLGGDLRPRGIGAFVTGADEALGKDFAPFLVQQAALDARADFDTKFPAVEAKRKPVTRTKKYSRNKIPKGMVAIPAATVEMEATFRNRECGFYGGLQPPLSELHKIKNVKRAIRLGPYAIDLTPVTNAQFKVFLDATKYVPKHPENFLKHWADGAPPPGKNDHPVVSVDLEDARAYAKWAGKRLPTEEQWQYAAQGPEKRLYPWGNEMRPGVCNDGRSGGTTPVTAFPDGRSPFGCYDMCGNVWELTESERSDGRTRFCILKGGSYYKAQGSVWYADGGPQPASFAAKMLLMWPGTDRCSAIGFRCAIDLAE